MFFGIQLDLICVLALVNMQAQPVGLDYKIGFCVYYFADRLVSTLSWFGWCLELLACKDSLNDFVLSLDLFVVNLEG